MSWRQGGAGGAGWQSPRHGWAGGVGWLDAGLGRLSLQTPRSCTHVPACPPIHQLSPSSAATFSFSAEADPLMRDFEAAAAGGGKGGGGGDDEQIDDDIAIEGGAHQLAPNVICPLSAKPVGVRPACLRARRRRVGQRACRVGRLG